MDASHAAKHMTPRHHQQSVHSTHKMRQIPSRSLSLTQARGNAPIMADCLIALTSSAGVTTRSDSPSIIRRYNGSASAGDATAKASARSSTPAREDCSPGGAAASAAGAGAEAAADPSAGVPSIAAGDMAGVSDRTKAAKAGQCSKNRQCQKRTAKRERQRVTLGDRSDAFASASAALPTRHAPIQTGLTDSTASKQTEYFDCFLRKYNQFEQCTVFHKIS